MSHTHAFPDPWVLKFDALRDSDQWTAIGPGGRVGDFDSEQAALKAMGDLVNASATTIGTSHVESWGQWSAVWFEPHPAPAANHSGLSVNDSFTCPGCRYSGVFPGRICPVCSRRLRGPARGLPARPGRPRGRPPKDPVEREGERMMLTLLGERQSEELDAMLAEFVTEIDRAKFLRLCLASIREVSADLGWTAEEYLRDVFETDEAFDEAAGVT